jgi:hypothetical protein
MSPHSEKIKPRDDAKKKPLKVPECEDVEGEVWYPPEWFLVEVHDVMINRIGGWTGFEVGLEPYKHFLKEVEKAEGIYRKAAILLKCIATSRMFQDGHHRTAYIVTRTFLEKNDAEFGEKDEQIIIRFIKDIRIYSIEEIEGWLRNGKL